MDNLSLGPAKPKTAKKSGVSPNRTGGKAGASGKGGSKSKKSSK